MSQLGQTEKWRRVRRESVRPQTTDMRALRQQVRFVTRADIPRDGGPAALGADFSRIKVRLKDLPGILRHVILLECRRMARAVADCAVRRLIDFADMGGTNARRATARVHHASRCGSGLAACGARSRRLCQSHYGRTGGRPRTRQRLGPANREGTTAWATGCTIFL
jgi:hypothetical protein